MLRRKFAILGPQGSGKGTQARMLAKELGIPHISIGALFREEVERGSPIGKEIKEFMDRGDLVPTRLNDQIVANALHGKDGFILDGYPRTDEQARFLQSIIELDKLIVLKISDELAVKRIAGRRVCSQCGEEYHLEFRPPKIANTCDLDNAPLEHRTDDKPDAVKKRLGIYHRQTEPIIRLLQDIALVIDGEQSIEKVHADILAGLKEDHIL